MEETGGFLGAGMMAIIAGAGLIIFLMFLVLYVFGALGLYKIASNEGHPNAWMAWVPIVNFFLIAMLVNNDVHEGLRGKFPMVYGIVLIGSFILGLIFAPLGYVSTIFTMYAFYFLVNKFSENAVIHVIVAVVTFGMSIPLQLFRIRNRENRLVQGE